MIKKRNIIAICGSTRDQSSNKDIIEAIAKLSQDTINITCFDITSLPHFNQDITDEFISEPVISFRKAIDNADGVLICTPEYVFSLPGVLKNAIEWTVSTTLFMDKPTALITASSSGEKAHESLLLIMNTLGIKTHNDICLLISGVKSRLDSQGNVIDQQLTQNLKKLISGFEVLMA